jgi:uncharacterized protein
MGKIVFIIIVGIVLVYLLACIALFFWQNRLIFFPSNIIKATPKDYGLEYEEVWLPFSSNNSTRKIEQQGLCCWWIPNQTTSRVLLYFHGNSANIGNNLTQAYPYYELGFSILLVDYRSYGKSEGNFPTEKRVYEDAQKAWYYLTKEKGISAKNIIVFGHSLGGAIAIELATRHPEISGLIIEGSFTSLIAMANYRKYYKIFPLKLLLHQRFNSLEKVKTLTMPILFIHGTGDEVIPFPMSKQLFQATNSPKQLLLIPEGTHNDIVEIAKETYLKEVEIFMENVNNYLLPKTLG